jgi:hypothetical protein
MSWCQSSQALDGEHRWEWWKEEGGYIWRLCMNANCGEVDYDYIDTGSGR